jgi:hypothetical protein
MHRPLLICLNAGWYIPPISSVNCTIATNSAKKDHRSDLLNDGV